MKICVFVDSDLYQLGHEIIPFTVYCDEKFENSGLLWCYSICSPRTLMPVCFFLVSNGMSTEIEKKHL